MEAETGNYCDSAVVQRLVKFAVAVKRAFDMERLHRILPVAKQK